ncbi:MAG TPA: SPOR domain-containing protein [Stenotrophomonas sp.]|nr:SPOR domain-containing protein [Stenotrophomonas sp.]
MDTALKQRLIGAIVLVALAVIFLPMLVKGPAPDSGVSDVPIEAPPAPADGQFETRELPLVSPGNTPQGGAVGMNATPGNAPAAVTDRTPAADAGALPPAAAAGNYAVNFGAYASEADANAVIARLKQAQLPGFSEQTQINGRPAWRVRIGPYADHAQAESVRLEAVKVRSDVNAQVVVLNADAANLAPAPSAAVPAPASTPVAAAAQTAPVRSEPLPPTPAPTKPAAPTPKPSAPVAATPNPAPATAKPAAAAAVPKPTTPAAPAASGVGFAVQLGAFGRVEDANALRDRARAAGFSAFVEQVRTDKGTLNRVRVGPVANRADAEQLKAQVASKVGVAGMVRPHP